VTISLSLEKACDLITDGTHYTPKDIGKGIPFLTVKDVYDNRLDFEFCSFVSDDDYRSAMEGNSAPQLGDVLFSKDGTVGKVHVVATERPFAVLSSLAILRPKRGVVDPRYLGHVLKFPSVLHSALKRKTGSAIRRIVLSDLKRIQIPVPSIEDQRRIATILDAADALRAKRRAALAKLDILAQSIFIEMFGDPSSNPHRWPVKKLDELVCEDDSINYGVVQPGDEEAHGVPLVRVSDLIAGQVRHSVLKRISASIEASYKRSRLRGDEILVSCVGTIGVVALVSDSEKGFNIARAIARIRPSDDVSRIYLAEYLMTDFAQRYFTSELRTVSQPTLNIKQLGETHVLVPPLNLQRIFEGRIHALTIMKAAYLRSSSNIEVLFSSLQHRAFGGDL